MGLSRARNAARSWRRMRRRGPGGGSGAQNLPVEPLESRGRGGQAAVSVYRNHPRREGSTPAKS